MKEQVREKQKKVRQEKNETKIEIEKVWERRISDYFLAEYLVVLSSWNAALISSGLNIGSPPALRDNLIHMITTPEHNMNPKIKNM